MNTSPSIIDLILMQRTGYKAQEQDKDSILKAYESNIARDYQSIKNYLPIMQSGPSVLDIGAGLAAIDVYIYKHYAPMVPKIYLLDRQGVSEKIYYDFFPTASKYNCFSQTLEFMEANGVDRSTVMCFDADADEHKKLFQYKFDIIISLLSCGFHYPVSTYIDLIKFTLNDSGVCILDLRKDKGQVGELKEHFPVVETISTYKKVERVMLKRKA